MEGTQRDLIKSFVSESELADVKRRRQEEWEKTRKPGQPLERPEMPIDHRSLYDRLQEQKKEKDAKFEEEHKFGNQICRLDEDDADFLTLINQQQTEALKQNEREEQQLMHELNEHRTRQAVTSRLPRINLPTTKIIPGSAKRKRSLNDEKEPKSMKIESSTSVFSSSSTVSTIQNTSTDKLVGDHQQLSSSNNTDCDAEKKFVDEKIPVSMKEACTNKGVAKTGTIEILGFLPGIGPYVQDGGSSSSDSDSDDEGSLLKCFTKKHYTQKQMLKLMRKGS